SIESDHYESVVLTTMIGRQDLDDKVFAKLVQLAGNCDSDHYASQILTTALSSPGISPTKVQSVLDAASHINSDHYLTEVLIKAAPTVKNGDSSLKDAYRSAARKISSETYYGRALRAI